MFNDFSDEYPDSQQKCALTAKSYWLFNRPGVHFFMAVISLDTDQALHSAPSTEELTPMWILAVLIKAIMTCLTTSKYH